MVSYFVGHPMDFKTNENFASSQLSYSSIIQMPFFFLDKWGIFRIVFTHYISSDLESLNREKARRSKD